MNQIKIVVADITTLKVNAIVNAAERTSPTRLPRRNHRLLLLGIRRTVLQITKNKSPSELAGICCLIDAGREGGR